jgi:hypothetical protein
MKSGISFQIVGSIFIIGVVVFCAACWGKSAEAKTPTEIFRRTNLFDIRGLSFVAPPRPFKGQPMQAVKAVGANWIAVIPYAYTIPNEPKVHFNSEKQWWGERPEGVRVTLDSAQKAGLKVMLKPQVYVPGSWTGGIDYQTDAQWQAWETDYEAYLLPMAALAQEFRCEMLCVGTEFKVSVQKRPEFWRNLIKKVRAIYKGKLTYAANWDEFFIVSFWEDLDAAGCDAYFPLVNADTPSVVDLKKAWIPVVDSIRKVQKRINKPIIFTEFGYMPTNRCAYNAWEVEPQMDVLPINEISQANAYQALFEVWSAEKYWLGGFLWKWFPERTGLEPRIAKDYTPQGKLGEKVLKKWYDETEL